MEMKLNIKFKNYNIFIVMESVSIVQLKKDPYSEKPKAEMQSSRGGNKILNQLRKAPLIK